MRHKPQKQPYNRAVPQMGTSVPLAVRALVVAFLGLYGGTPFWGISDDTPQ